MARRETEELKLLDTHVWLWSVDDSPRLSGRFADLISDNPENVCVSAVSCWEIAMLHSKGRIDLGAPVSEWFEKVIAQSGILLTPQLAADAYSLPGKFHDDPADRMIVATARSRDCLLLTENKKILDYPHVNSA
ncbi:MAG: type II toxin-antitoxin system VapC family toxin [Candidatus Kapaibacterium sp.]